MRWREAEWEGGEETTKYYGYHNLGRNDREYNQTAVLILCKLHTQRRMATLLEYTWPQRATEHSSCPTAIPFPVNIIKKKEEKKEGR